MSQATIVRARQKALEDLPNWAKCCEKRMDIIAAGPNFQGELVLGVSYRKDERCPHCGTVTKQVKSILLREPILWNGIIYQSMAVDCFDFDEGPAEVTHDH